MNSVKISNGHLMTASMVLILIVSFLYFGMVGIRTVGAMLFLFIVPSFLLLDLFSLKADEKIFYSIFLGIGFFPLAVFYVDRIIPSLRLSIIGAYILIAGIWFYFKRIKKTKFFS